MAYAIYAPDHVRSLIFVDSMPPKYNGYLAGQYYFGKTMRAPASGDRPGAAARGRGHRL
jgi:hypothetical protein